LEAGGFSRFRTLSSHGNVIPICREVPADCLTPVMAYLATAGRSDRSFLLESVEGGERIARYSFVGSRPWMVLTARGRRIEERAGPRTARSQGDFLDRLREIFHAFRPVVREDLPRFTGGAVGYVAYDAVRLFERIETKRRRAGGVAADLPDVWLAFYDTVLAFDHLRQSLLLITSVMTEAPGGGGASLKRLYDRAVARLDGLAADLARGGRLPGRGRRRGNGRSTFPAPRGAIGGAGGAPARGSLSPRAYGAMVEAAREHIRAGDIYQVVLSQRFERRLSTDPFAVYRTLRRINPSPYMYFLRDGRTALAGASPEMLVRVEGRRVELHPIAGTRPRGADPIQDAGLEAELRGDAKERAEHVMLVDLGRNDLGRVCAPGTVRVPEFMKVERFSHVMHLVSSVTGELAEGKDAFDALRSTFPAGTVSGAPKVRAMEIIEELEKTPRGPYAGAVCYIDHSGNLDSCIIIRTMVAQGRRAWVQAGSGIVADSVPRREYEESHNKARAVLAAIEGAGWAR
jgi:anthranilate synthase component 1